MSKNFTEQQEQTSENVIVIENKGTGDVWQVMVSTSGDKFRGKNEGNGGRIRQLGGMMEDTSIQQLSSDMLRSGEQNFQQNQKTATNNQGYNSEALENPIASEFEIQHGSGRRL